MRVPRLHGFKEKMLIIFVIAFKKRQTERGGRWGGRRETAKERYNENKKERTRKREREREGGMD